MNMPLISRDIKLCAQKVEPWRSIATRCCLAVRGRGPRFLSGALTGRAPWVKTLVGWSWRVDGLALNKDQG
jgi:hypothetical protein